MRFELLPWNGEWVLLMEEVLVNWFRVGSKSALIINGDIDSSAFDFISILLLGKQWILNFDDNSWVGFYKSFRLFEIALILII